MPIGEIVVVIECLAPLDEFMCFFFELFFSVVHKLRVFKRVGFLSHFVFSQKLLFFSLLLFFLLFFVEFLHPPDFVHSHFLQALFLSLGLFVVVVLDFVGGEYLDEVRFANILFTDGAPPIVIHPQVPPFIFNRQFVLLILIITHPFYFVAFFVLHLD